MRKLTLVTLAVFVIGTIAALLTINDGVGTIVDSYSFLTSKTGMHYFFVVKVSSKQRRAVEVTEAVYNAHGYGDVYNDSWTKYDGYQETNVQPVGEDQKRESD